MPLKRSRSKPVRDLERLSFEAIGTWWSIEYSPPTQLTASTIRSQILQRIEVFDYCYSRFRPDSWISKLSRNAGIYPMPDDAQPLFDFYQQLYRLSGGAFTPLIGQTLADAGYDAAYSLRQSKHLQTPPPWPDALDYDFPRLRLHAPALLDFGAAGKGYLVDIIGELLGGSGVDSFCVNAGGDILTHNFGPDFKVGLEHPGAPGKIIGTLPLADQSLCGSSGNRRAWGKFHHIINPHTLQSPRRIAAVWVKADQALIADGLATALFFMPARDLATCYSFEYALLYSDLSLEHSTGFDADFFTA